MLKELGKIPLYLRKKEDQAFWWHRIRGGDCLLKIATRCYLFQSGKTGHQLDDACLSTHAFLATKMYEAVETMYLTFSLTRRDSKYKGLKVPFIKARQEFQG